MVGIRRLPQKNQFILHTTNYLRSKNNEEEKVSITLSNYYNNDY